MHLIQYAVRVKGTQRYLPRPQRRDGRGGSWMEPRDFGINAGQSPDPRFREGIMIRTFANKKGAKNFLASWLKGKYYGDGEGSVWEIKQGDRRAEDMEIVELTLELPQP